MKMGFQTQDTANISTNAKADLMSGPGHRERAPLFEIFGGLFL